MQDLIPLWVVFILRLYLISCSICYVYWLINRKWTETEIKAPNKLRKFIGTGAVITLFLIIHHGIAITFPFIQRITFHWWEGDINIPVYLPLSLIITVWIKRTLDFRYITKNNRNTKININE